MDAEPTAPWGIDSRQGTKLAVSQPDDLYSDGPAKASRIDALQSKTMTILKACRENQDLDALINLATTEHGLVSDEVRREAWPIILGYSGQQAKEPNGPALWRGLPRHKDEDQVALDVNRSFIYYPKNESDKELDRRKSQLSDVIVQVLRSYPMLNYFQGFHDIVQVFLLVLGREKAAQAVAHVSLLRIRDFMLPSLSPSLAHLQLLPAILYVVDPELCQHLSTTQPFFALAATLTLYAHDIQEYADIARLFDFLLAQPAVVSVYFFTVIILSRRNELFEIPADEPEMLHSVLCKLPKPLNLEAMIARAMTLFAENPPEKLPWRAWSKVSQYSVLKTTRAPVSRQSVPDGEALFANQVAQLNREQLRKQLMTKAWQYRRPVGRVGIAISVVLLSYWLRRNGLDTRLWDFVRTFRF